MPSAIITRPDWAEHTHWLALVEPVWSVVLPVGHPRHIVESKELENLPRAHASHPAPDARFEKPSGQMHLGLLIAPEGSMPSKQTHWLTLDAPVVLVVRPAAHATHVLSLVSDW